MRRDDEHRLDIALRTHITHDVGWLRREAIY